MGGALPLRIWIARILIWNVESGTCMLSLNPGGRPHRAICLAFSPDGRQLASGGWQPIQWGTAEGNLRLWDVTRGVEVLQMSGHHRGVSCVSFSRDGRRLVSGSWDTTVRIWEADQLAMGGSPRRPERSIQLVKFSVDGKHVCGSPDMFCAFDRHWDARTGVFLGEKAIGEEPSLYDPVASQLTCRTSKNNPETTIVSIRGESVGRFPAKVFPWGLHPNGRTWAENWERSLPDQARRKSRRMTRKWDTPSAEGSSPYNTYSGFSVPLRAIRSIFSTCNAHVKEGF